MSIKTRYLVALTLLVAGLFSPLFARSVSAASYTGGCFTGNRPSGTFTKMPDTDCANSQRNVGSACYFAATNNGQVPGGASNAYSEIPCSEINAGTVTVSSTAAAADKNTLTQPVKSDCKGPYQSLTPANCGIVKFITDITNALSATVGVIIVASIVWAGIQYSSAGADPQKVGKARARIQNSILALLIFIFMFAFLTWLVPGGIF